MKKYIAFLRGINISGKNKVPMSGLKAAFEALGFAVVKTYLNSGNVVFSAEETGQGQFPALMEAAIRETFGVQVPVFVISQEGLQDILQHAPSWWGDESKEIYDNLIFILPPATFAEVSQELGAPKEELEKIQNYKNAVFWSFRRKDYQKTNWWPKTASTAIGGRLTIRTANTVRKMAGL